MFRFINRKLQAWHQTRKARDHVTFDDKGITRTRRDGMVEHVGWDKLESVHIATSDEGPWCSDVLWLLSAKDHGCVVPSDAEGMDALLTRLQELPRFNNGAVVQAMGSMDNASFLVWSRGPETP